MRKSGLGVESIFLSSLPVVFLLAALAAAFVHTHAHLSNDRAQYAVGHLTSALLSVAVFSAIVAFLYFRFDTISSLGSKSTGFYLLALTLIFSSFWLPVLLAGGFVQDDWMLLAGASIRKIIYLHPQYSWQALDTVDGNFRPLGTVLYVGLMLKLVGLHPLAFLATNFVVSLGCSLVAFFIVRAFNYGKLTGAAAAILYMSRGLIYTETAWMSALGDGLVILLCGLTVLAVLKAIKPAVPSTPSAVPSTPAGRTFLYHAVGFACFCLAMLAKQSAFAMPAIVAMLLFLRPGDLFRPGDLLQPADVPALPRRKRTIQALTALLIYGATAAFVFLHAKTLLRMRTPYPLGLSFTGLQNLFAYPAWYFATLELPGHYAAHQALPSLVGLILFIGFVLLIRRSPALLGPRPRDVIFALLAALFSLSLLLPLGDRSAPYYGSMFAFWVSIALGIVLTSFAATTSQNPRARVARFFFCILVLVGFLDVRLKQTALIPSGGYIWGTFGMDNERIRYRQLAAALAQAPGHTTLVLVDPPIQPSYYASMALLADPDLERILVYDSKRKIFLTNDLDGGLPRDTLNALNDAAAYNWTLAASPTLSHTLSTEDPLWLAITAKSTDQVSSPFERAP